MRCSCDGRISSVCFSAPSRGWGSWAFVQVKGLNKSNVPDIALVDGCVDLEVKDCGRFVLGGCVTAGLLGVFGNGSLPGWLLATMSSEVGVTPLEVVGTKSP